MADKTVVARIKRQRESRAAEGWQHVSVWVPTATDAEDVRTLAAERRSRAEKLHGLSEEVSVVTPETQIRIAKAITEQGAAAYTTPSGAVLHLMTQLSHEGDLRGIAVAVAILSRAKPANARFVIASVPGKIMEFFAQHCEVETSELARWAQANPMWADKLKTAVRDPERFSTTVEAMMEAIKYSAAKSRQARP